ncbi:hypothetical protein H0H92_009217 [Tricholoma furcatifolium]|nr:hypothetical protein H0H92_009217 [Tricholoma furcatifolium]
MATPALNKNNSAIKRIMQEAKELANDPSTDYSAAPLEDDIFEWHCTLRGPAGTEFEGGLYHFRILLPAEYPFRPPSLMMLTPNGRFELNTKTTRSCGNQRGVFEQGFFPLKGQQAVGVGSIEYPPAERKRLAALSREWVCPHCKESNLTLLPDPSAEASGSGSVIKDGNSDTIESSTPDLEESAQPEPTRPEPTPEPAVIHSIEPLLTPGAAAANQTRPGGFITRAAVDTPTVRTTGRRPPLVLVDGAIFDRRKSLQLPHRPMDVPIPPSLLESPYLGPKSIFQRTPSAPHDRPTEEDERWLQDTVPLSPDAKRKGHLSTSSSVSSDEEAPQPVSPTDHDHTPLSPPSVQRRHSRLYMPPRVHSAPCIAKQEFFAPKP